MFPPWCLWRGILEQQLCVQGHGCALCAGLTLWLSRTPGLHSSRGVVSASAPCWPGALPEGDESQIPWDGGDDGERVQETSHGQASASTPSGIIYVKKQSIPYVEVMLDLNKYLCQAKAIIKSRDTILLAWVSVRIFPPAWPLPICVYLLGHKNTVFDTCYCQKCCKKT